MKIYQIITEDPQVLTLLDPRGNYQVQLDNGTIKTFPDKASADAWAKDPKNIAQSRWDKQKATTQIDPKTGKPVQGLTTPTDKQRKSWDKLTPAQRAQARANRKKINILDKIKPALTTTPWNSKGWKPAGVGGWAVALLTLVGAYQLARTWWKHQAEIAILAKWNNPSPKFDEWLDQYSNLAGQIDFSKISEEQLRDAIIDSESTPAASAEYWAKCREYASNIVAPEVATIVLAWIASVKSKGIIVSKFTKLLQTGFAAGGATVGAGIAIGAVTGAPAFLAAGTMLFSAVTADLLVAATMTFLATEPGKLFTEKVVLWAMGALFDQGKEIVTGINILDKATGEEKPKGPAQQTAKPDNWSNPEYVDKRLGINK